MQRRFEKFREKKYAVSSPKFPDLYEQPKTHKPGNKMRSIVSNINAPSSKIAKYLTLQAATWKPPKSFCVKNTMEFTKILENKKIGDDEEMVSFDIEALFPRVPVDEAIKCVIMEFLTWTFLMKKRKNFSK
jgi:hypothetical protein